MRRDETPEHQARMKLLGVIHAIADVRDLLATERSDRAALQRELDRAQHAVHQVLGMIDDEAPHET